MFWKVAGFSQPSPIEAILDREDFSLEELLDEDDLIQECKSLNGRLINFLGQRENVKKLITYLVETPDQAEDVKRKNKYPYAACEVFCCEVDPIFTTLLEDDELMKTFFTIIEDSQSLNCTLVGYFGRVLTHLMIRKSVLMFKYLENHPAVLDAMLEHLSNTSVTEIVLRLVGGDEQMNTMVPPAYLQWLAQTPLVEQLVGKLGSKHDADTQRNVAQVLGAVIRSPTSPIARKLSQPESLDCLIETIFSQPQRISVSALTVCIAMLDPQRQHSDGDFLMSRSEDDKPAFLPAIEKIMGIVGRLVEALDDPESKSTQDTPYGVLNPPVGFLRLKVTELLAVLMASCWEPAQQCVVEAGAFEKCFELFLKYPFNNALHQNVLNLAGYIGHLTIMANHILEISRKADPIRGLLSLQAGWQTYQSETLSERNDREDVTKWGCGRPTIGTQVPSEEGDRDPMAMALEDGYPYGLHQDDPDIGNEPGIGLTNVLAESEIPPEDTLIARWELADKVKSWEELVPSSSSSSSESSGNSSGDSSSDEEEDGKDRMQPTGAEESGGSHRISGPAFVSSGLGDSDEVRYDSSDDEGEAHHDDRAVSSEDCVKAGIAEEGSTETGNSQEACPAMAEQEPNGEKPVSCGVVGDADSGLSEFSSFNYWKMDLSLSEIPDVL
ncbi:unnamed protein product [Ostreobium quekettii]|uniref:Uncharacterized protein n=1 Tax=Ostreobium quekettii TaxID=121088 RepID=A0A8S1IUB1_9CHLO|nr:unnamed protein product [Ostreobium quekettii]